VQFLLIQSKKSTVRATALGFGVKGFQGRHEPVAEVQPKSAKRQHEKLMGIVRFAV
jgi:hypothetical protein